MDASWTYLPATGNLHRSNAKLKIKQTHPLGTLTLDVFTERLNFHMISNSTETNYL